MLINFYSVVAEVEVAQSGAGPDVYVLTLDLGSFWEVVQSPCASVEAGTHHDGYCPGRDLELFDHHRRQELHWLLMLREAQ